MSLRAISVSLFAFVLLVTPAVTAAEFQVPDLRSAVTDGAGILSPATRRQLETALQHLRREGGTQLAVLTVPDLAGLTIEQVSIQVVDAWKLGSEKGDDGVLLFVAPNERKVRIEVGQGLEGVLTDAYSKRIIDEGITPLFRGGDMNGGVTVGVYQIARLTNPDIDLRPYLEGQLRRHRGNAQPELSGFQIVFIGLLMLFILLSRMGFLPFMAAGAGYGHRSRSGGFGGGGFSGGFGGGGGGFSGGGASGGW